jgi:5-methylcytosine-specific restriction endonuclease McrA
MPVCKKCHLARCLVTQQKNKEQRAAYRKKYYDQNPEKARIRSRNYRKKNPEKVTETFRSWVKRNPEANRLRGNRRRAIKEAAKTFRVSAKELQKLRKMNCFYCGNSGGCVDHVVPLSRGGDNGIGNYLPSCLSCNSSKKDKFITEWKNVRGW